MRPLLVIDDLVVMDRSLVLLPAVPRAGLPVMAGDAIDLCTDEGREEALVLSVDPDPRNPALVRLRIAPTIHASRGVEVWPSEGASGIVLKRPASARRALGAREVVRLSGAVSHRKLRAR